MTDDRKILRFPTPPDADPDRVAGIDLGNLTEDILDVARLAALDAARERLAAKLKLPPERKPEPPREEE